MTTYRVTHSKDATHLTYTPTTRPLGLSHPRDDHGFPWWTMHGRGVLIPEPGLDLTAYQIVKNYLL